ncbi:MAG: hypothetical protein R3Y23_03355 [Bacillota bacterium]
MTLSQNSLNKIKTYVGFGIKSGKVIFGTDNILLNKKIKVVLYDPRLSQNALDKISRHGAEWGYEIIALEDIPAVTHKENCKVIGLKKGGLTDQVIKILEDTNNI